MALNNLATLYEAVGAYAKAEPLLQRAVAIQEKAVGPDHPALARPLDNLGWLYFTIGNYAKAEPLYLRALMIQEKASGPDHPDVAIFLDDLAAMYARSGLYTKAEPLYQRAVLIREKAFGQNASAVAESVDGLARVYLDLGNYAGAESLFKRVLAIQEKANGPNNPAVANALTGLAIVYSNIANYTKAESLYQQALEIYEKAFGPEHPGVATALHNLAQLYKAVGPYSKVERLYQRALATREKMLGPDHPAVADSLNGLGLFYSLGLLPSVEKAPQTIQINQYLADVRAKSEPLLQRALAIREKAFGPDHPAVAESLNNLAALYQRHAAMPQKLHLAVDIGDYPKVAALLQRALAILEKSNGSDSPQVAGVLSNLAGVKSSQHDYHAAVGLFKKSLAIQERQIQNVFTFTSEEQKLAFLESISGNYTSFLSLIRERFANDPDMVRDAFELVISRKGMVLDAQSRLRESIQGRLSQGGRQEWDRLSALRSELSQLLLNRPQTLSVEQYRTKLASLEQQIGQSEQRLATESAVVARDMQQRHLTTEAIAKRLHKKAALVEFVEIQGRYLAFVLRDSGRVSLIDLGRGSDHSLMSNSVLIYGGVKEALRAINVSMESRDLKATKKPDGAVSSQRSLLHLQNLYTMVWLPLEQALGNADKVFISPDGQLNLLPFAALVDNTGRFLVERYRIAYVTSGRELVGTIRSLPQSGLDLLLVANPAFDYKPSDRGQQSASLRSRDFKGAFVPLPGTEREAKMIPPLVPREKGQRVLVGERATEDAIKPARSPRILHLATHGFFLPDEEVGISKVGGLEDIQRDQPRVKRRENPLVRSGLAFAGANHAGETTEGDDGILTALEVTAMDLYGTDLVVLSACQTAVGEVKTGEGVFGLRRAFALAGAKNLLMSLWIVSDEITADQMKAFYQNLQKLPPAEALRQAQLETIKELKAKEGIASPALWAPFILQGAQALGR